MRPSDLRTGLAAVLVLLVAPPLLAGGRPMTVEDLLAVKTVSDPQVAPDGRSVAYVVSQIDSKAQKTRSAIWLVPLNGGEPRQLTTAEGTNTHPRWSPDARRICFQSDRGGSSQVWVLPLDGGEARRLTDLPIDISGPIWSPDGHWIAFTAEVYPGTTPAETAAKDKEKADSKSKVRVFDKLLIRHWNAWDEGKRSHLFVADATTGKAHDLTPRLEVNTPPAPFGGSNDYAFSPDGKELAFTAEPRKDAAWSTNTDIWTVPVEGGELRNVTEANPAADAQPAYSPDGKSLAYVSQARPGFESDLWVVKVRDRSNGAVFDVSSWLDRPVLSFVWADRAGSRLVAVLDDRGSETIATWEFDRSHNVAEVRRRVRGGTNTAVTVQPARHEGDKDPPRAQVLVFLHADASHPAEVYRSRDDGSDMVALTHHNAELLARLDLSPAEGFTFRGADGDEVAGWLIRPPGFDASKKYPVVFLIHGGPQGAWHDEWHARWNYPLFAAPGYTLIAINPRGSTGYGQKFTDQISRDWTGRVYEDLMKGLDHALKTYPFLDGDRVAALGGSYGGFMVNWIAGHTDRFRALVSHAGVFDLTSKYGTTEELWFPEWEFGGTPWDRPEIYREQSPSSFVKNFRTPTLVIHGALDFRVPDAQGLGMFTALQRRGVPSRFVFFPDEGHWILKPANRVVWWNEVHRWLERYLTTKSPAG